MLRFSFFWPIADAAHCGRPSGCRLENKYGAEELGPQPRTAGTWRNRPEKATPRLFCSVYDLDTNSGPVRLVLRLGIHIRGKAKPFAPRAGPDILDRIFTAQKGQDGERIALPLSTDFTGRAASVGQPPQLPAVFVDRQSIPEFLLRPGNSIDPGGSRLQQMNGAFAVGQYDIREQRHAEDSRFLWQHVRPRLEIRIVGRSRQEIIGGVDHLAIMSFLLGAGNRADG